MSAAKRWFKSGQAMVQVTSVIKMSYKSWQNAAICEAKAKEERVNDLHRLAASYYV